MEGKSLTSFAVQPPHFTAKSQGSHAPRRASARAERAAMRIVGKQEQIKIQRLYKANALCSARMMHKCSLILKSTVSELVRHKVSITFVSQTLSLENRLLFKYHFLSQ